MPKYKMSYADLTTPSGVHKLERDGFTRETIHKEMYKITNGARVDERRKIIDQLYTRQQGEK